MSIDFIASIIEIVTQDENYVSSTNPPPYCSKILARGGGITSGASCLFMFIENISFCIYSKK